MTKRAVMLPAIALFLLTAAFLLIRTGRDALYFSGGGLRGFAQAYVMIAALSIPQAMAVLATISRFGARRTRQYTLSLVVVAIALMAAFGRPGDGLLMTAFFAMVPLLFSIAFSLVWLLGSELTEGQGPSSVARAFSRFGASSIVGGAAGGVGARALASAAGPNILIAIGAGLVALALVAVYIAHRSFPERTSNTRAEAQPDVDRSMGSGLKLLGSNSRVRLLVVVAMSAALVAVLVEFVFYIGAIQRQASGAGNNTVFFANVYLVLAAISLVLQLFVAPFVQRVFGVAGGLLVLPIVVAGGVGALGFSSAIGVRAGVRITEGSVKSGIHRAIWEQTFRTIDPRFRPSVKVLVDGLSVQVAEGVVAGVLWSWLAQMKDQTGSTAIGWIAWTLAIAVVVWVAGSTLLARSLRGDPEQLNCTPGVLAIDAACASTLTFGPIVDAARRNSLARHQTRSD